MKTIVICICLLGCISSFAQYGPDGRYHSDPSITAAAATAEAHNQAQAQAAAMQAQNEQWEYQHQLSLAQQAEAEKIFSKDPWRVINGVTNFARGNDWVEFQGTVQEMNPQGAVFKGKWGEVLTISPDIDYSDHLIVKGATSATRQQNGNSTSYRAASSSDTAFMRPKVYGDDLFFVETFPYPATFGMSYEKMVAINAGYYSYTNLNGQVVTVHKLIYGTPCQKVWSPQEIAQAQQKQNAPKLAALKYNQELADKGDAYGLLRMGERYTTGDGVEKVLNKAREYLTKAVNAGSITAKNDLAQLPSN